MDSERPLCRLDAIPDGGSKGFVEDVDGLRQLLMAIRRGRRVFVYRNSCPHVGAPLDFRPGRFLNAEGTHILCANHGALFRIEDGFCLSGPCAGESLKPVKNRIAGGVVLITG